MINARALQLTMLVVFFVSGSTGLIYQSIWTQYLKLFLGHSAFAQSLVLVLFMGGLALGSWLAGRWIHKFHNPLLGYALIESVIGLLAIAFHSTFTAMLAHVYGALFPGMDSNLIEFCKWVIAASLILPAATLLGATFPLAVAGLLRYFPENTGRIVSLLYFSNSLGAAIGVLVSGFWMVKALGLPGTMLTAGLVNNLLALIVFVVVRQSELKFTASQNEDSSHKGSMSSLFIVLLTISFATGLASFVYEIAWIRLLSLVLGASTHAFELMLSAFVLGLAIGGFWIRDRIAHFTRPILVLAMIQIVMGLLALGSMLVYQSSFSWMQWTLSALAKSDSGYQLYNLASHSIAMLVMLPTTICAGMTLPLITSVLMEKDGESSVGYVYAANTVGAIVGVVISMQLLMPAIGLQNLLTFGASVDLIAGIALLLFSGAGHIPITTLGVALVASLTYFSTDFKIEKLVSGVYRDGKLYSKVDSLFHLDGKTSTVDVFDTTGYRTLTTNGKPDAQISLGEQVSPDEYTMALLAAIPMLLKPDSTDIGIIGMGSGITTNTVLLNPLPDRVVTVEIEAGMVEGARHFEERSALVFSDPRSHIVIDDAKTHFVRDNRQYDIIISEPSNPWVSGVASVFTYEFYEVISHYLKENGLFVQWLHLYEFNDELVFSILNALGNRFEHFEIYSSVTGDLVIVASLENRVPALEESDLWISGALDKTFKPLGILTLDDIRARHVTTKQAITPLGHIYPSVNSDYFPFVDNYAARAQFKNETGQSLLQLNNFALPAMAVVSRELKPAQKLELTPEGSVSNSLVESRVRAKRLMQAISSGQLSELPLPQQRVAIALTQAQECQANSRVWEHALVMVSKEILLLSPDEVERVTSKLQAIACSERQHDWLTLIARISHRDMAETKRLARALQPGSSGSTQTFLLTSELTATVALGEFEEALLLVEKNSMLDNNPHIAVKLLHMHALQSFIGQGNESTNQ